MITIRRTILVLKEETSFLSILTIKRIVHSIQMKLRLHFDFLFRLVSLTSALYVSLKPFVSMNFTDQNSPRNSTKTAKRPHSWLKSCNIKSKQSRSHWISLQEMRDRTSSGPCQRAVSLPVVDSSRLPVYTDAHHRSTTPRVTIQWWRGSAL